MPMRPEIPIEGSTGSQWQQILGKVRGGKPISPDDQFAVDRVLDFLSERIRDEYGGGDPANTGATLRPDTRSLIAYATAMAKDLNDENSPMLTGLLRTEAEDRDIYPNSEFVSPHRSGRAFDMRSREPSMSRDDAFTIADSMNNDFTRLDRKDTGMVHEVGRGGEHLHAQVPWEGLTPSNRPRTPQELFAGR